VTEWVVVDLAERPGLRAELSRREFALDCRRCGGPLLRETPILVTRLAPEAPVLLGLSDASLPRMPEDFAELNEALHASSETVRGAGADIPGPVVIAPLDVIAVAAARDLAADLAHVQSTYELMSEPLAGRYRRFLEELSGAASERRLGEALDRFFSAEEPSELQAILDNHPELLTEEARDRVVSVRGGPSAEEQALVEISLTFLENVTNGDLAGALDEFRTALTRIYMEHRAPLVSASFGALDAAEQKRDWEAAINHASELIEFATGVEDEQLEASVAMRKASALFEFVGGMRDPRLEDAYELLLRAVDIYDRHPEYASNAVRARALHNLGVVLGERPRGDPAANRERAIDLYRASLALTPADEPADRAMAQTNLSLALLRRSEAAQAAADWTGDGAANPDAAEDLDEAITGFHEALTWRSFDRDPRDWAYTQVNLGLAFSRRRVGDRDANLQEAIGHYEQAARGFEASGDPHLQGQALHNIASAQRSLAGLADDGQELLAEGAETAGKAIAMLEAGRAGAWLSYDLLGRLLQDSGEMDGARDAFASALEGASLELSPADVRETARALAGIEADRGAWDAAADAWDLAARAAAQAWTIRSSDAGRRAEIQSNQNIFRWAAYALARSGRPERAVEILELGRARQLGAWIGRGSFDLEPIRYFDPQLADDLEELLVSRDELQRRERLHGVAETVEAAEVAEALQVTLSQVRDLPGLAQFLLPPRFEDVAASAASDEAFAYLVTSPSGAVALVLTNGSAGPSVITVESDVTSTELAPLWAEEGLNGELTGYIPALQESFDSLGAAIRKFTPRLGSAFLRELSDALGSLDVTRLCLIPIGVLAILPLHAIPWPSDSGDDQTLLSQFPITYAPSGYVRAVAGRRAASAGVRRALVVGNPLPQTDPLPGAEREAHIVVGLLNLEEIELLVGVDATKAAVVAALPGSDYVHLACHGFSSFASAAGDDAGLSFAHDELLLSHELVDLRDFRPRLVVASACETGLLESYDAADEVLSVGTMFLAAGAAGVLSTLWSVADYPTALLMTRFYEGLQQSAPAEALREAQLWLASLSLDEEQKFVQSRARLRARWEEEQTSRGGTKRGAGTVGDNPWEDVVYWGAFAFAGA